MLAVLVLASTEVVLRALGLPPRLPWGKSPDDYNVVYTRALEAHEAGSIIVAFIGDSRVEWSLSAEVVQAYLEEQGLEGVEVFNLAWPGVNVLSIMKRLDEVGFYPDYLVVGYSHLSVYWSKLYMTAQPRRLDLRERLAIWLDVLLQYNLALVGYTPTEIWRFVIHGEKPQLSWLAGLNIAPRGRADVRYAIPREEAVAQQKQYYQRMYRVPMDDEQIRAVNAEFAALVERFRARGTDVLLMRMPLGGWALALEQENDRYPFRRLATDLGAPALDLNDLPGALELHTYDDLHVSPPSHEVVSRQIAEHLILPTLQ